MRPLTLWRTAVGRSCRGSRGYQRPLLGCQSTPVATWRGMYTGASLRQQNPGDLEGETAFAEIFRTSPFVRMGNPVGKRVEGEVVAVVGQNMYVDFGCKFHAVVPLPQKKGYYKGKEVIVTINDLEMTDHFLGHSKHISLLEADATLEHQ